jgi:dTDP-4-amino-4,6-dideoxygalactose transaminase
MTNNHKLALLGGSPAVTIKKEFHWPIITEEEIQAVTELLRHGDISDSAYGEPIRKLEETWADYLGVEFALARVDGTAALHSACFAAGIGPGDEVIVQSYTWIATVGCIVAAGGVPVFADIDPQTYTLDPADARRRITPRTKAIVVVHLWGHPAEMDTIREIADEHKLVVIEDASHAHGGMYRGRKIGTLGDIAVFSLQASKAIPAGEGGILATRRREYFERALLLAQSPGRLNLHLQIEHHRRFKDTGLGAFKYRINPLNAVIGRMQMERFEGYNEVRQRNMDFLTERLTNLKGVRTPYTAPHVTRGGYYGYPLLYCADELDELPVEIFVAALQAEGVEIARERYPLMHLAPMYREQNPVGGGWPWNYSAETRALRYQPGDLPVTEELYPRLLSIPSYDKAIPCEDLFEQYAQAFRKVAANVEQLKTWSAGA